MVSRKSKADIEAFEKSLAVQNVSAVEVRKLERQFKALQEQHKLLEAKYHAQEAELAQSAARIATLTGSTTNPRSAAGRLRSGLSTALRRRSCC